MRISDWSSDVCSSDLQYLSTQADDVLRLGLIQADGLDVFAQPRFAERKDRLRRVGDREQFRGRLVDADVGRLRRQHDGDQQFEWRRVAQFGGRGRIDIAQRSEEHTSELQSLMSTSYAVF